MTKTAKPLEWEDVTVSKPYWKALSSLGEYQIQHRRFSTFWWRFNGAFSGVSSSLETAKNAAQADYERRSGASA